MESQRYSIIFNGELLPGIRREQALRQIAHFTNLAPEELLDSLFSIKPVIINQVDDPELAQQYLQAFADAGLLVELQAYEQTHDEITNAGLTFSHYAPIARQEHAPNYEVQEQPVGTEPANSPMDHNGPFYRVIFNGTLLPGTSREKAIDNICHLTNSTPAQVIEQIFSVVPVLLLETKDRDEAQSYHTEYKTAGLSTALSQEDCIGDSISRSRLHIRTDLPLPRANRPVRPFSYLLSGLMLVCTLIWALIFIFSRGYFDHQLPAGLAIRLQHSQQGSGDEKAAPTSAPAKASAASPETLVAEQEPTSKQLEPTPEPKPEPKPADVKPLSTDSPPSGPITASNSSKGRSDKQQAAISQTYFIELLNWFAQPENQGYDQDVRRLNLEGEIKVKITISRNGEIQRVEVLQSSSEKLSQITRETALKASPYPKVPKEIPGENYSFTLPLKYTLED